MKTIKRFPLQVTENQTLLLTEGFGICCVDVIDNQPFVWVAMETDNDPKSCDIFIHVENDDIPESELKYIGTFKIKPNWYHVFYGID